MFNSVRPSAPASRAAPAIAVRSETLGLSLAQRASPLPCNPSAAAATAAVTPAQEWANMRRRSSTLGQLTLASTAMTAPARPSPRAAASALAARP